MQAIDNSDICNYYSEYLWWESIAGLPMQPNEAVKNSYANTPSPPKEAQTENLNANPTFYKKHNSSLHIFRQKPISLFIIQS